MRALRRGLNAQGQPEPAPPPPPPPVQRAAPEPAPVPALSDPSADTDRDDYAGNDYADPPLGDDPPYGEDDDGEDDGGSQFDYRAPFTRRRNPLRMWTLAAVIFALLAGGTAVAVNYYGMPEWLPFQRATFGENGQEIFRVRGTISNTSSESLDVPNVLVVFRDRRERDIVDWVVAPSKRRLAPGETVTVTEAIADIPPNAEGAWIGWAQQ